ncbi:MAG TPA: type 4a pilus biogenesis protein PilO [Thermoanaerobaculia bacterium]|jgi:type IV pilus assembly protein PilO|nr:type 4a pilus biogenesis protein PilO [Thermoanaerobaculia bacterium]
MAITLDDKPWWVGLAVGLGLAGALVYAAETFVIKDLKGEIASADAQIVELDQKISKGQAAERKLPQFREEVNRLELELGKLRRILPSTRNTEEIIKKIKQLVDQGDFTLRKLSFPALAAPSSDPYSEWPISVSVDGRYHDLAILFNKLGNFSRIMNVEQIVIKSLTNQETRTISSDFVAKTFVYVEPVEDEAPAAAAKPGG